MSQLAIGEYLKRLLLTALVVVLALLLWQVADVFLLAFAGVLVAVLLRTLADFLSQHSPLSPTWSLVLTIFLLVVIIGGGAWLIAPGLVNQLTQLTTKIPEALTTLREQISQTGWGQTLLEQLSIAQPSSATGEASSSSSSFLPGNIVGRVGNTFFSLFNSVWATVTNLVFFLFIAIFLASEPKLYRSGIIRLFPADNQTRVGTIIKEVRRTLQLWLFGKLVSMLIIAVLVTLGLWLLGMPLALSLGVIAGVAELIPIFGPFIASVPAILLAFLQGPWQAFYVVLLYLLIQQLEGNIIMPIVHKETVYIPPALTLLAIFVMGALFGFLGLLVATPILAVILIVVKMLYLHDELGEEVELPGGDVEEATSDGGADTSKA